MTTTLPNPMTLTAARRIATRRRYGSFKATPHGREYYLHCPFCHARLDFSIAIGQDEPRLGDLDGVLVRHLTAEDTEDRCPHVTAVKTRWRATR